MGSAREEGMVVLAFFFGVVVARIDFQMKAEGSVTDMVSAPDE